MLQYVRNRLIPANINTSTSPLNANFSLQFIHRDQEIAVYGEANSVLFDEVQTALHVACRDNGFSARQWASLSFSILIKLFTI
ncbi:hypothetical protein AL507_20385 [Providencia stuartii]|nr:hypothetical protein AL507_20385 [Providencia stuartii]